MEILTLPHFDLQEPISVKVSSEGESLIGELPEFGIYSIMPDEHAMLLDMQEQLEELYDELMSTPDTHLGKELQERKHRLKALFLLKQEGKILHEEGKAIIEAAPQIKTHSAPSERVQITLKDRRTLQCQRGYEKHTVVAAGYRWPQDLFVITEI